MARVLLAEIGYRVPGAASAATERLSSGLGYSHPSAPGFYAPRLEQGGNLDRQVFSKDDEFGAGSMAEGDLIAQNLDGELDYFVADAAGVYGHTSRLLTVDEADDYATAAPLFTGTMESVELNDETATFRWRDDVAKLIDTPIQYQKYTGTNALPNGVEGVEDVEGSWKPVLYGSRLNIPAILVNTSKWIYQVSCNAGHDIAAVYDKGAAITRGTVRASLSALEANTPAINTYDLYAGADGIFFRLGSDPLGDVTCDPQEGANAAARTVGQVWKRILIDRAGVSEDDIVADDVTALDGAQAGEVGVWCGRDETSIRDALNTVAASAGAVYFQRADGKWRIIRVVEPSGTPVASLITYRLETAAKPNELDIGEIERLNPEAEAAVPACLVTVEYAPLGLVQTKDTLPDVALPRLQRLERECLTVASTEDADILTVHPNARRLMQRTALLDKTKAQIEADHRAALFGAMRSRYRILTQLSNAVPVIDLMDVVRVTYPRWNLRNGKLFLVTGIRYDFAADTVELLLWG